MIYIDIYSIFSVAFKKIWEELEKIIDLFNKNKDLIGEIDSQVMHYIKLEKYFGWKPRTECNKGLAQTIEWYKTHLQNINL